MIHLKCPDCGANCDRSVLAAALRSAACLGKRGPEYWEGSYPDDFDKGWNAAMAWIESLASELNNNQPSDQGAN